MALLDSIQLFIVLKYNVISHLCSTFSGLALRSPPNTITLNGNKLSGVSKRVSPCGVFGCKYEVHTRGLVQLVQNLIAETLQCTPVEHEVGSERAWTGSTSDRAK